MNLIALVFSGHWTLNSRLTDTMAATLASKPSLTIHGLSHQISIAVGRVQRTELRLPDLGHLDERIVQALSKFSGRIVNRRGP